MAAKVDILIESVRYAADHRIEQVRGYVRRGPTYSDLVLLSRADLFEALKSGKKLYTGSRKDLLASTFSLGSKVALKDGALTNLGAKTDPGDYLQDTPLF